MPFNYLVPRLSPLLAGYNCSSRLDVGALAQRLASPEVTLIHTMRVFHGGVALEERVQQLRFNDGEVINEYDSRFEWDATQVEWGSEPGILEEDIRVEGGALDLRNKYNRPSYTLNWAPGKKSYFINLSPKFADQRIIEQIALFKRYVDTCSTVWVDRDRDYGQSFVLVNPFSRPISVRFHSDDGRELRGNRVEPRSARVVPMERLLKDNETAWMGQIQVTANNRLLVSELKHPLSDPLTVVDIEHLDPFRTDPTYLPGFRWLRQRVGRALADRHLIGKNS
jgi:hypothetical protein